MKNKKAFSLIELIIVISIISLLGVVGMSYQWAQNQKVKNTRTIWDLGTLNNSILSYMEEKNTLPNPKWNKNYFLSGSEYAHGSGSAFWVHWFVTESLLPKKYLNYLPLDPRTNQYYAYWKTIGNNFYEVAWVLNVEWDYISKLIWNYPADNWPYSLIREYNWPNFISDKSKQSFPYNPVERVLVWKINNFSWTVTINWNSTNILNHILVEWDTIIVPSWATATIFFSDWSQSVLWDASWESKLVLSEMNFNWDDNLLTRINLFLSSWTLWTKATNLNSEGSQKSAFEVSTQDTTAAVRWTIFWVNYNWATTSITVTKWKVEITPQSWWTTIEKTDWESYNSPLTQPDFPVVTKTPNNTKTWAVLENKNLAQEYIDKNPEEEVFFQSKLWEQNEQDFNINTQTLKLKIWTDDLTNQESGSITFFEYWDNKLKYNTTFWLMFIWENWLQKIWTWFLNNDYDYIKVSSWTLDIFNWSNEIIYSTWIAFSWSNSKIDIWYSSNSNSNSSNNSMKFRIK
jgi:prepilin-type N-terminal cleavage/methylation domain-containing protein